MKVIHLKVCPQVWQRNVFVRAGIGSFGGISESEGSQGAASYNHFYTVSGNISVNGNLTLEQAQKTGLEEGSTEATLQSLGTNGVLQMVRELLFEE